MKIRPIKAILLAVTFLSSAALFASCDGEKKEGSETPVEQVNEEAPTAPVIEEAIPENEEAAPESDSEVSEDASVEAAPVEKKAPVVEKKEVPKVAAAKPVKKEIAPKEEVQQEKEEAKPNLVFDHTQYEFGTIKQGEKVTHLFTFTNKGNAPLIISSAKPSCGCTVPSWPKEPIMPGESGEIKAVFNSTHKSGRQNKSIRVFTNMGEQASTVFLKGEVIVPAAPTTEEAPTAE